MNYETYWLADLYQCFDKLVAKRIAKIAKELEAQLKPQLFDWPHRIIILIFLPAFLMALNMIQFHEGVLIWLFHFFKKILHVLPSLCQNVRYKFMTIQTRKKIDILLSSGQLAVENLRLWRHYRGS